MTSIDIVPGETGVLERGGWGKENSGFEMYVEDKTVGVPSRLDIGPRRAQLCWEWQGYKCFLWTKCGPHGKGRAGEGPSSLKR